MPRRTKACATCRQKRIKCDATMPHCQMCIKFNRQCPGPTDAPLMFIDTSSYPSGKKPRKRPSPPSSRRSSPPRPVVKPDLDGAEHDREGRQLAAAGIAGRELVATTGGLPPELAYVTFAQVSGRHVLNEALFSTLARFFCAEGRTPSSAPKPPPSWLHALPRLALQSPSSSITLPKPGHGGGKEALSLAIRATTAAFGGIEAQNTGMLEYAAGLYGDALRAQGRVVAQNAGGAKGNVGMDMVAASVMLGMFEAVVATTGRAYAEHTIGAAKMLDAAMTQALKNAPSSGPPPGTKPGGPGARPDGNAPRTGPASGPPPLLINIFFHTRIQLAFVLLTSTDDRIRNDPIMHRVLINACTWPSYKMPLNQQIIRPLAHLITLTLPSSSPTTSDGQTRSATYTSARDEVSTLWTRYQAENHNPSRPLCWYDEKAGRTDFRDPFTAIQYAYFAACWLLLELLKPLPPPSSEAQTADAPASPASTSSSSSFPTYTTHHHTLPHRPQSASPPPSLTSSPSPSSSPTSTHRSTTPTPPSSAPDHYALILSVASFLKIRDVGFSYLRLHLPLCLVGLYAPGVEMRWAARRVFAEWERGMLRGIGGLGGDRLGEVL